MSLFCREKKKYRLIHDRNVAKKQDECGRTRQGELARAVSRGGALLVRQLTRHCYSGHRRDAVRLEERLDDGMYAGGRVYVTTATRFTLSLLRELIVGTLRSEK